MPHSTIRIQPDRDQLKEIVEGMRLFRDTGGKMNFSGTIQIDAPAMGEPRSVVFGPNTTLTFTPDTGDDTICITSSSQPIVPPVPKPAAGQRRVVRRG